MTDPPKTRHGFAGPTAPPAREFDRSSVTDWINVLHHAAQVPQGDARYADARDAMEQALGQIGHLQRSASAPDRTTQNFKPVNPIVSGLAGVAQGASLGIGEPLAGAASAITGGTFGEGAQKYREGLERVAESNPATYALSEFAGQAASAAVPARSAVGAIQARQPLTLVQGAGRLAKGAASGAAYGGVAGFSAGGEDPGDIQARLDAAKRNATIGAALGSVVTGIGLRNVRSHVEGAADLVAKGRRDNMLALEEKILQRRLDALDAPPTTALTGAVGTAEEQAVAKALGIPVEQVQGRVGQAAVERSQVRGRAPAPAAAPAPPPVAATAPPSVAATAPATPAAAAPPAAGDASAAAAAYLDRVLPRELRLEPTSRSAPAIRSRPEMTVAAPAGPYQLAAPATRMQSMPANVTNEAIRLSGRHPELLEPIPTDVLQMHHDLGQAFGTGDPAALRAVAMELARRLRGAVGRGLSAQ